MKLRKTRRHSKRRRAHSKKARRTYKMRGGFKEPEIGDRIMYFRLARDDEGYAGTIVEINARGVLVNWDQYSNPIFPRPHWDQFVQNYYAFGKSHKLESQDSAKKTEGTEGKLALFPQIAYLKPPTGTMWQRLAKFKRSIKPTSKKTTSKKSGSRHTSTDV